MAGVGRRLNEEKIINYTSWEIWWQRLGVVWMQQLGVVDSDGPYTYIYIDIYFFLKPPYIHYITYKINRYIWAGAGD